MRTNGRVRTTVMVRFSSYGPNFPRGPLLASGFFYFEINKLLINKASVFFLSTLFSLLGFEIILAKGKFDFNSNINVHYCNYIKLLYSVFARKYHISTRLSFKNVPTPHEKIINYFSHFFES